MPDRPIIFSGPMVRALLDGRKSQTRRILKPQPYTNGIRYDPALGDIICHNDYLPPATLLMDKGKGARRYTISDVEDGHEAFDKHRVGDRLWVREAWKSHSLYDHLPPREIPKTKIFYMADDGYSPSGSRVRSSTHMPRWASRLTLIVTGVRVERVQSISDEDAIAEGVVNGVHDFDCVSGWFPDPAGYCANGCGSRSYKDVYARLWESLHGPGSWAANPWVVALTFTTVPANIDARQEAA